MSARRSATTRKAVAVAIAVTTLAWAGCAESGPRRGGTVVIASGSDLDHANPLVSVDAWTNEILRFVLFTPLVRYGPDLGFEPALAETWEMNGDTAVVFRLRRDVRWHDGTPTTAHDVAFTFDRARDPATAFPNADYFARWNQGTVIDSFTIRFTLEPHAEPLAGWPFTPIVPRHLLADVPPGEMRHAAFNRSPVGNGPFRFVSQRANDRWVFEANPDYPDALGGPPLLDRLIWRVIPDNTAQVTEVRVGQVDLAVNPRPEHAMEQASRDGFALLSKPSRRFMFVAWNGQRPPLDDPRVRRALALAIDRQAILDGVRRGLGEPAIGPIMPFHWAYDRELDPLPHDRDRALSLLAEAGIRDRNGDGRLQLPDGSPFTIELKIAAGVDFHRDLGEVIRNDLDRLGVRATTRPVEVTTLFADVTAADRHFDAALLGWSGDIRLDLRDTFHSRSVGTPYQFASYRNPEVDELMDRATAERDRSRATPLWRRVQEILRDEQPWTLLYYHTDAFLARERLRGADVMDIRGGLVNVTRWWVDEGREPGEGTDE